VVAQGRHTGLYVFGGTQPIPIPINDNRDEAATRLEPMLMGGSLKRSLGMVANDRAPN